MIAQGKKQVKLGQNIFIYDPSQFFLTAIDLHVVSRVAEATKEIPCLDLFLKLDMGKVRELLSMEEMHTTSAPSDATAMATAEATPDSSMPAVDSCACLKRPAISHFLAD